VLELEEIFTLEDAVSLALAADEFLMEHGTLEGSMLFGDREDGDCGHCVANFEYHSPPSKSGCCLH